jgi:hypothetical protein
MNRAFLFMLCAAACGGSDKPADNASNANGDCPAGMVKQGGDCVAPEGETGPGKNPPPQNTATANTSGTSTTTAPSEPKTPYDKDNVEMVLRRAAVQVKANCGAATDENGKANGPFGQTKASITLGRNGHVHGVTVPDPYAGKPVGNCVVQAFQNLIFPPYAAPADVVVDWDVEIVKFGGK